MFCILASARLQLPARLAKIQQTQNIQANAASIGQQEQANQMKMAQGAERVDLLQRKGEMMSREMQANQNKTEFGFAANRLEKANQAREEARKNLESGITQTATAGLKMGNMFGKSTKNKNVYYAFGHQHIGWTLAAVTGKAINELIKGSKPNFDINPFNPDRFN